MDWIAFKTGTAFAQFYAVQGDGHLSSQCMTEAEVISAANGLRRQIDVAERRMKIALQRSQIIFEEIDDEDPKQ